MSRKKARAKSRARKNKLIILIVILCFALLLNLFFIFKSTNIIEIREIESSLIVSDKIGFDLNTSVLTFGEVTPGGSSTRGVSLGNSFSFPIKVYVHGKGNMEKFILPSVTEIKANNQTTIKITAKVPENTEFGEYRGKVVLIIKKA